MASPGLVSDSPRSRLLSVDALRGIIMVLMTLDHVRDFFSSACFSPLDLARYYTGAVHDALDHTCLCPRFRSSGRSQRFPVGCPRRKSRAELARFLLTRGLWLIFLELTVVRLAWFLSLDYEVSLVQVIWIIGWSMIALAGMVFLPDWLILTLAVLMVGGHNLLDGLDAGGGELVRSIWTFLHRPGMVPLAPDHSLYVLYPLLPWPGVMALGYLLGKMYEGETPHRSKRLIWMGVACAALFLILRGFNLYGDPGNWYPQRNGIFTFLSFINLEKYPPSLLFLLITLGIILLGLGILDRSTAVLSSLAAVYGRVPLFYYVLHLFVIHLSAAGLAWLRNGEAGFLTGSAWFFREGYPVDYGYDLPIVYANLDRGDFIFISAL